VGTLPVDGGDTVDRHRLAAPAAAQVLRRYRRTLQSDRRHLLEQFELKGVARKVAGVGSVGTRAWALLPEAGEGIEPLFLQGKEAQASVLADFCGRSTYANQGQRVVAGQHLMQAASDIFLGWDRITGFDGVERDFLRPPTARLEVLPPDREDDPQRHGPVSGAVRLDTGTGSRPVRVPRGDCRLPG